MFAATVDDQGVYRLSIRRIRTLETFHDNGQVVDVRFRSRAKAKACADELEKEWGAAYTKTFSSKTGEYIGDDWEHKNQIMIGIIDIINKYKE